MTTKQLEAETQEDCLAPAKGVLLGLLLGGVLWAAILWCVL